MTEFLVFVAVAAVSLVAGVVFSQPLKDWVRGVPSEVRASMGKIETSLLAKVKAVQANAIAEVHAAVTAPQVPVPPAPQAPPA